ncbi:MAG: endonuclease/exonuclease/phosphatase family protein [Balneolaceae bacterium]|nr:endonuclease/exonuclease/phosphatase family protein [Balneolaceae bacterium]
MKTSERFLKSIEQMSGMVKIVFSAIVISFFMWTPQKAVAQNFNISSYNIFYYTPPEHDNSWEMRKDHVANVIRFHDIALWGSQEGEHNQLQDLREMLGQEYIGVARDDGDTEGEHSAIFYDPDMFRVLEHDTFWLSKTPDRPSMDWGVNFHRICTWGKFEHIESGKEFYVYNVHFDHESQEARENSSRMVLEHVDEHTAPDAKILFLGDLNAVPGNKAYEKVIDHGRFLDAYNITENPPHGPTGTFNGFSFTRVPDRRIDYIFLTDHFSVKRYGVLTDSYDGLKYPSDHFPVVAEIEFK